MKKEIWKNITGYENIYKISNLGRIKSLQRTIVKRNKLHILKERILKPSIQKCEGNYIRYRINLYKNNKPKVVKVHRLVAREFLPNPFNKPQVNHIDNNPLNNNIKNLEWVTNKENVAWATKQGRQNRGENNGMSKLKEKDIIEIRRLSKEIPLFFIQKKFNISNSHLHSILRKELWKFV